MFPKFRFFKNTKRSRITQDESGKSALTKTDDFYLCAIRSENEEKLLGVVLLTEAQRKILNASINDEGIKFTRK